ARPEGGGARDRAQGRDAKNLWRRAESDRRPPRVLRQLLGTGPCRVQGGGRVRKGGTVLTEASAAALAVRKRIVGGGDGERAFDVFTRRVGTWWPLHTHSIGGDRIVEVVVEERVGGRIYERHSDGGEGEWGRVLVWEPPARFAMSWYPGHDDSRATLLAVR